MRAIAVIFLVAMFISLKAQQGNAPVSAPAEQEVVYTDTVIKWMTLEQAEAAQKKNPKKILVSIYATWCRWCKLEDSVSFRHREIAHYINQNFYPVKFNAESKPSVTFKGTRYDFVSEETRYVHDFARYALNGKLSYPGLAFFDETGKLIEAKNGYMDAYYMEAVLHYYGTNAFKDMGYREYEYNFEGKVEDPE